MKSRKGNLRLPQDRSGRLQLFDIRDLVQIRQRCRIIKNSRYNLIAHSGNRHHETSLDDVRARIRL